MFSITRVFPAPGPLVRLAYAELDLARSGTDDQKRALGKPSGLPRPWDPPSCPPALRSQVWAWLDQVAGWINHEYVWVPDRFISSCWPGHPHIAHELAVLADLRRTAGYALTSDALEQWPSQARRLAGRRAPSRVRLRAGDLRPHRAVQPGRGRIRGPGPRPGREATAVPEPAPAGACQRIHRRHGDR